jgi:hypothetical protein
MPMGDFPAGAGPAGADPVYKPAPQNPPQPAAAIFYDPSIKQYDPTIAVHPIDQIVASRCTAQKNQSASSPDLGTRIRARFAAAPPSQHMQIAYQETSNALADLISAGDIQLVGVTLTRSNTGAQVVIPNYVNLRTSGASPAYPLPGAPTSLQP